MSGSAEALAAQVAAARRAWVELEPGRRIQIDTPSYWTARRIAAGMREEDGDAAIERVAGLVHAWEGFTGDFFLGAGVGNSEPVEPIPPLVRFALASRVQWLTTLALKALELESAERKKFEASSGN